MATHSYSQKNISNSLVVFLLQCEEKLRNLFIRMERFLPQGCQANCLTTEQGLAPMPKYHLKLVSEAATPATMPGTATRWRGLSCSGEEEGER
jgi:hypothetical protein